MRSIALDISFTLMCVILMRSIALDQLHSNVLLIRSIALISDSLLCVFHLDRSRGSLDTRAQIFWVVRAIPFWVCVGMNLRSTEKEYYLCPKISEKGGFGTKTEATGSDWEV
jgi:hypothetical protein